MLCVRMKQMHTWSRRTAGLTYIGGKADLRSCSQKGLGLFANRRQGVCDPFVFVLVQIV